MTIQGIGHDEPKKVVEHVACFSVAVAALFAAALVLQWLMSLIP